MASPTASQIANLIQVSEGRLIIKNREVAAPAGPTIQIAGALNGRFSPGSINLSTSVPIETTANANSVPMLTSSPTRPIGSSPARTATTIPEPMVAT
jgi:hypothetical protein